MAQRITQEQIEQINRLYQTYGTYAAVAREVGCSATTVKKYIDPNFECAPSRQKIEQIDWSEFYALAPIALENETCHLQKGEYHHGNLF